MREIVLDLDSPEGYNGLGDVISLAWFPEPSTMLLLSAGIGGLLIARRRMTRG